VPYLIHLRDSGRTGIDRTGNLLTTCPKGRKLCTDVGQEAGKNCRRFMSSPALALCCASSLIVTRCRRAPARNVAQLHPWPRK